MNKKTSVNNFTGRREFISKISMAAALGLVGPSGISADRTESTYIKLPQEKVNMPEIMLGSHRISRLICGSNPILGYSYMGQHTDRQMKEYYTSEHVVELLQKCEQSGITAHQSSSRSDYMKLLREKGSNIKILTLLSGIEEIKPAIETNNPIALVHHGGVTDKLFAEGKSGLVHDFVKAVKDNGLLAGVSAHNPDVIKEIANKGWEVDFFMTCFYFLTRKMDKPESIPTLPVGSYHFMREDPKNMTQVIRQVKQPCLAFKILGAGRLCSSQKDVIGAFKFAFENIKPIDGVIVGMFPWYFDEVKANSQYAIEYGRKN
jgi:hypothetical protein